MAKRSGETVEGAPGPVADEPERVQVSDVASSVTETVTGLLAGIENTQAKEYVTVAIKTAEEIVAFNQGNLEAVVKSSQIWAAGVQDLTKVLAATAQAQVEQTLATVKALATVKSVQEAVELQTSLARASLEKVVTETSKITDASVKLAEQTWAPLTARVTVAVEKFGRVAV